MELKISEIIINGGTQPRESCDQKRVEEYASEMREGVVFPPVDVFFDGKKYWLADGFHRRNARVLAGFDTISVTVHQGGVRDAILFSVSANASHGLRRTNEDKRRAVMRLLTDSEWGKWSDREIARQCAVSNRFVSDLRPLSVNSSQMPVERKVTRNGKTYTQDTSKIGRRGFSPPTAKSNRPRDEADEEIEPGEDPGELEPPVEGRGVVVKDRLVSKSVNAPKSRSEKLAEEREHQREVLHDYIVMFLERFPAIKREAERKALIEWLETQGEE